MAAGAILSTPAAVLFLPESGINNASPTTPHVKGVIEPIRFVAAYARGLHDMDWIVNQFRDRFTQAVPASLWPEGVLELLDSNEARKAGLRAMMPALDSSIAKGDVE